MQSTSYPQSGQFPIQFNNEVKSFWQRFMNGKESVPWIEFVTAFWVFCNSGQSKPSNVALQAVDIRFRFLKDLILDFQSDQQPPSNLSEVKVTETAIHKIISWFPGPFNMDLLERVTSLMHHRWFHGNISKELATTLVIQTPADCFLVRFSSQPGHFALTMKHRISTQDQPISYRIDPRSDGTWVLGENLIFPCLEAVVYNNDMLKNVKPILREDVKRR